MPWWRCESALPPLQRSVQRSLRSRVHCLSRSSPDNVQHKDQYGNTRPAHLSNLEWMQLQHYKRWRRRLTEDPYQAVFGASNAMLDGKGLKDCRWIHKSFPTWLVGEWETSEREAHAHAQTRSHQEESRADGQGSHRSSKVEILDHEKQTSPSPASHVARPSSRSFWLDGVDDRGISSPSDPRKAQEQSHISPIARNHPAFGSTLSNQIRDTASPPEPLKDTVHSAHVPQILPESSGDAAHRIDFAVQTTGEAQTDEASARDFSSREPQYPSMESSQSHATWRQTALQRHYLSRDRPEVKRTTAIRQDISKSANISVVPPSSTTSKDMDSQLTTENTDWPNRPNLPVHANETSSKYDPAPRAARLRLSDQTNSSDVASLSAADIRAAMGRKHSLSTDCEKRKSERERLERVFEEIQSDDQSAISSSLEKEFLDERRRQREKSWAQVGREMQVTQPKHSSPGYPATTEPSLESSVNRIKKWLEQGSAMLSNHFWQDPEEEADVKDARKILDKLVTRVRKSHIAMKQVAEDLQTDVPASKPLLKRLKENEDRLDSAVQLLRQHLAQGKEAVAHRALHGCMSRPTFHHGAVELELESACKILRMVRQPHLTGMASPVFKNRLQFASKISHQSAQLTGHLFWGLQSHSERPEIRQRFLINLGPVSDSLFALRDTQTAIARLVDCAMVVYGIEPAATGSLESSGVVNEIKIPQDAPESALAANFDERGPLANSHFRPFGSALKRMGQGSREKVDTGSKNDKAERSGTVPPLGKEPSDRKTFLSMPKENSVLDAHQKPASNSATQTKHKCEGIKYQELPSKSMEEHDSMVSDVESASHAIAGERLLEAKGLAQPSIRASIGSAADRSSAAHLPTHYVIIIHNPQTDSVSLITSIAGPPRDTTPAVPIPQALSMLNNPSKFVSYLDEGFEIVTAKKDMLVLRNTSNGISPHAFEPLSISSPSSVPEDTHGPRQHINPIDGTSRLSPTGYAGLEENAEQLEQELQNCTKAASLVDSTEAMQQMPGEWKQKRAGRKEESKRAGGVGTVVKTAIWATALCYMAGMVSEICTCSF